MCLCPMKPLAKAFPAYEFTSGIDLRDRHAHTCRPDVDYGHRALVRFAGFAARVLGAEDILFLKPSGLESL